MGLTEVEGGEGGERERGGGERGEKGGGKCVSVCCFRRVNIGCIGHVRGAYSVYMVYIWCMKVYEGICNVCNVCTHTLSKVAAKIPASLSREPGCTVVAVFWKQWPVFQSYGGGG
jgi:hypothetical protein